MEQQTQALTMEQISDLINNLQRRLSITEEAYEFTKAKLAKAEDLINKLENKIIEMEEQAKPAPKKEKK